MVNYACAFSQLESGKYFEGIITEKIVDHLKKNKDMRCPADHISRLSLLFTVEHVNIRIKELFCFERVSSLVLSKKYKTNYKTINEN